MYAIPAAVTMGNASASLVALQRAIDGGETEVSLAALAPGAGVATVRSAPAHSDSSALAVLLAAIRHGRIAGKTVRVSGVPPALRSLAKLYGVEDMICSEPALAGSSPN